jgi:ATP-binding cassette, subfamily G (WHITE), member 2
MPVPAEVVTRGRAGYYKTSAYFMSKLLCDMIPVRVIPTIIFAAIVYFMVGYQVTHFITIISVI